MWLTVASSLRAFNTVQGSGMPTGLWSQGTVCPIYARNLNHAAGLFRLSALFNTKRLRSGCAHDTYHWPKQLLPWIQMSRFSGNVKQLVTSLTGIFNVLLTQSQHGLIPSGQNYVGSTLSQRWKLHLRR